jgi:hypothetical protein
MSSNLYYNIKDAQSNHGFSSAEWLTPNQVINKLNLNDLNNSNNLIYPNEFIFNNSNKQIVDIIFLAKYKNKYGSLKLKSVLLSQLLTNLTTHKIHVLNLPKDSFYWCSVVNGSLIPKFALRAGYDIVAKQFSYIGRTKVKFDSSNISINLSTNLVGSLTNIYEYIPAIVLQLHDLSFLDDNNLLNMSSSSSSSNSSSSDNYKQNESFWCRLRQAIKNKSSKDMDFNFISNNYEVLCLKKQPASLKQSCILKLNNLDEQFMLNENHIRLKYLDLFRSLHTLPNSIRNLLWPCVLTSGQCIVKNGKIKSSNGNYEIFISTQGSIKFSKIYNTDDYLMNIHREVTTFEKNVESILVSQDGIFIIYDYNQPMRKPNVLYKHQINPTTTDNNYFFLELSDSGYLRIVYLNGILKRKTIINILNLNDYFFKSFLNDDTFDDSSRKKEILLQNELTTTPLTTTSIGINNLKHNFCINFRLVLNDLLNLVELPIKFIKYIMPMVNSLFRHYVMNRLRHSQI